MKILKIFLFPTLLLCLFQTESHAQAGRVILQLAKKLTAPTAQKIGSQASRSLGNWAKTTATHLPPGTVAAPMKKPIALPPNFQKMPLGSGTAMPRPILRTAAPKPDFLKNSGSGFDEQSAKIAGRIAKKYVKEELHEREEARKKGEKRPQQTRFLLPNY